MKKALIVASVASMIDQFNMPNIRLLQRLGYQVDVACNMEQGSSCSPERIAKMREKLTEMGVGCYHIDCPRSVLRADRHFKALSQLSRLAKENHYALMHCHSPIGGMLARLAFRSHRKKGTKVIYTAHGFHFYKGAPLLNWCLFYPVEKLCARWTDVLITINQEDLDLATRKMSAGRTLYIPGVGISVDRFAGAEGNRAEKRRELGIPEDAFLLCSVGELNVNKNHEIMIRAMAKQPRKDIHYMIAGVGEGKERLLGIARELGLEDRLHLLGYRNDVEQLYRCADVCVFPSIREGQGLAAVEGMASGLPLIVSDNRGTRGFLKHGENALVCKFDDADAFADALTRLYEDPELRCRMAQANQRLSRQFDVSLVCEQMEEIYRNAVKS